MYKKLSLSIKPIQTLKKQLEWLLFAFSNYKTPYITTHFIPKVLAL
jgi:hypothetical protein